MALTGPEVQSLHKAIVGAFTVEELERLVRFTLNKQLADIAAAGTRSDIAFELIDWARRRGLILDLVRAAAAERPSIEEFRRLIRLLELDDEDDDDDAKKLPSLRVRAIELSAGMPKSKPRRIRIVAVVGVTSVFVLVLTSYLLWAKPWRNHEVTGGSDPDPDRSAAEHVLSIGGTVRVNDEEKDIAIQKDLPAGRFRLTSVLLGGKGVSDTDLAYLKACTGLKYLNVSDTNVGDAGLAHLSTLPQLAELDLDETSVTDKGLLHLESCPSLRELHLVKTLVSDDGLSQLKDHKGLIFLGLRDTRVTANGVAQFAAVRPCEIEWGSSAIDPDRRAAEYVLSMKGVVRVSGTANDINDVKQLPGSDFRLLEVQLGKDESVNDEGMARFAGCVNLTTLALIRTGVTSAGLIHFKKCKNLAELTLWGEIRPGAPMIGDAGLAHFRECKGLTLVWLNYTAVSDKGIDHLMQWTQLKQVDLTGTRVSEEKVRALHEALPNCRITWGKIELNPSK